MCICAWLFGPFCFKILVVNLKIDDCIFTLDIDNIKMDVSDLFQQVKLTNSRTPEYTSTTCYYKPSLLLLEIRKLLTMCKLEKVRSLEIWFQIVWVVLVLPLLIFDSASCAAKRTEYSRFCNLCPRWVQTVWDRMFKCSETFSPNKFFLSGMIDGN